MNRGMNLRSFIMVSVACVVSCDMRDPTASVSRKELAWQDVDPAEAKFPEIVPKALTRERFSGSQDVAHSLREAELSEQIGIAAESENFPLIRFEGTARVAAISRNTSVEPIEWLVELELQNYEHPRLTLRLHSPSRFFGSIRFGTHVGNLVGKTFDLVIRENREQRTMLLFRNDGRIAAHYPESP